jgi:hypothetical protein
MLMMMSPIQGAINYGREDEAYSHSNHEGLIAASCIEKEVRFGSLADMPSPGLRGPLYLQQQILAIAATGLNATTIAPCCPQHATTANRRTKTLRWAKEVIGFLPGQGLVGLMGRQFLLNGFEQVLVDDSRLLPGQGLTPVTDFANEKPVAEEIGEGPSSKRDAPRVLPVVL